MAGEKKNPQLNIKTTAFPQTIKLKNNGTIFLCITAGIKKPITT